MTMVVNAEWSTEQKNELPDSAFLYIEPGGSKDAVGKSVPRSLRHLPYRGTDGAVDRAHLASASQTLTKTNLPEKVKDRLRKRIDDLLGADDVAKGEGQPRDTGKFSGGASYADHYRKLADDHEAAETTGWKTTHEQPHPTMTHEAMPGHAIKFGRQGWTHIDDQGDELGTGRSGSLREHLAEYVAQTTKGVVPPRDGSELETEKTMDVEKVGWTDEARDAAAAARAKGYEAQRTSRGAEGVTGHYAHPDGDTLKIHSQTGSWSHTVDDGATKTGKGPEALNRHLSWAHGPQKSLKSLTTKAAGSKVQTLIFDKGKYPTEKDVSSWANDHGFTTSKIEEAGENFQMRQEDPDAFSQMRTITLTEGVQAVVGFSKKAVKALNQAFNDAFKSAGFKKAEYTADPVYMLDNATTAWRAKVGKSEVWVLEKDGDVLNWTDDAVAYRKSWLDGLLDREQQAKGENAVKSYFITKSETGEMKYTLGVVYPASKLKTKEQDFHGDWMTEVELEKSAWGVMQKDGGLQIGLMHRPNTAGAGRVVESYIYRGPDWKLKDTTGNEQVVKAGDWLAGVVWNDEAWQAIKSGTLTGYSLQGIAHSAGDA